MRFRKLALAALALVPSVALLQGCGGDEGNMDDATEAAEDAADAASEAAGD